MVIQMGKLKDLITDAVFNLDKVEIVSVRDVPTLVMFYSCNNGAKIAFHAHPKKPEHWLMHLPATNELGAFLSSMIIDAFCKAGGTPTSFTLEVDDE